MSLPSYIRQRPSPAFGSPPDIHNVTSNLNYCSAIWDCHWRPLISFCSRWNQYEQWWTYLGMPTWFPPFTSHIAGFYASGWNSRCWLSSIKTYMVWGPIFWGNIYLLSELYELTKLTLWVLSTKDCYLLGLWNFQDYSVATPMPPPLLIPNWIREVSESLIYFCLFWTLSHVFLCVALVKHLA